MLTCRRPAQVLQKAGVDKGFRLTSNSRNEAMFQEAAIFANHLKLLEKDMKLYMRVVEG